MNNNPDWVSRGIAIVIMLCVMAIMIAITFKVINWVI